MLFGPFADMRSERVGAYVATPLSTMGLCDGLLCSNYCIDAILSSGRRLESFDCSACKLPWREPHRRSCDELGGRWNTNLLRPLGTGLLLVILQPRKRPRLHRLGILRTLTLGGGPLWMTTVDAAIGNFW